MTLIRHQMFELIHELVARRSVDVELMDGYDRYVETQMQVCGAAAADLITSERHGGGNRHAVVLDVDLPVHVVESSPGRHHLYIDVDLSWRQYRRLLRALSRAGIIERRWAHIARYDGYTSVRPPWKLKEVPGRG